MASSNLMSVIQFTLLLLISVALISYMPVEIYSSGYTAKPMIIPDEFDAWDIESRAVYEEKQLVKAIGSQLIFQYLNTTQKYKVSWSYLTNTIEVQHLRSESYFDFGITNLIPKTYGSTLQANWDAEQNASYVQYVSEKRSVDIIWEDYNGTRNDILSAYNDGILNCTLMMSADSFTSQKIGAREIVFALLSFRLPSIFANVHPLMGFLMSLFYYVPLAFITYMIVVWLLHGGG